MRWTGFGLFAFLRFCCVSLVISKNYIYNGARANILVVVISSLLVEVSPDEAKRRGRRKTLLPLIFASSWETLACEAPDAFPVVAWLPPKNRERSETGNASGASQARETSASRERHETSWSLFLATVCHVENVSNAFSEFPCFVKRLMDTEEKFKLFPKKLIVLHRVPVDRNEEKAPAVSQRKAKIYLSL